MRAAKIQTVKGLRVEIFSRPLRKNTTRPLTVWIGGTDILQIACGEKICYTLDSKQIDKSEFVRIIQGIVERSSMQLRLNANHLKLIAIIAMTIDHVADLIYPGLPAEPAAMAIHIVGRLTAPIMWFFVCEGYYYTHNVKRYMLRMGIFAVISHFAYCFAFGINPIPFSAGVFNQTSVMYPLFVAILILWIQDNSLTMKNWVKNILIFILVWSAFPADWSCIAVLAILEMHKKRGNLKAQMREIFLYVALYAVVSFFFVSKVYALVQAGVLLVYPVLKLYNGEKGKAKWMKWFFYLYYPVHLIVIGVLRICIYGDVNLLF